MELRGQGRSQVKLGNEGGAKRDANDLLGGHEVGAIEAGPLAVGAFFVEEIQHAVGGDEDALGFFVGADDGFTEAVALDVLDGDFPDVIDFLAEGLALVDGEGGLVADHKGHDALGEFDFGNAEDFDGVAAGKPDSGILDEKGGSGLRAGSGQKNRGEGEKGGKQGASVHKVGSGTQAKSGDFGKRGV
jgi:hypothetical protein